MVSDAPVHNGRVAALIQGQSDTSLVNLRTISIVLDPGTFVLDIGQDETDDLLRRVILPDGTPAVMLAVFLAEPE